MTEQRPTNDRPTRAASRARAPQLEGVAVWEGKDAAADFLRVTGVEITGDATSSVRKGSRIVVYDWSLVARLEGRRGGGVSGAGITATIEFADVSVDTPLAELKPAVASAPLSIMDGGPARVESINGLAHGKPAATNGGADVMRAMKTHEALGKLVERKGVPLVRAALADVISELQQKK
jgi:hypothetical protein